MKLRPKTIALILAIGLFLFLLFQNTQVVSLRLLFWTVSMSQIILVSINLLLGFVAGIVISALWNRKKRAAATPPVFPAS